MKTLFIILVLVFNLSFIFTIQKYGNAKDALKDYPHQDKKNGKKPKFVYFKIKNDKIMEMDYFSKVLYKFMATNGVRPYFVNLNDDTLLGLVAKEAEINTEVILDVFKDVIQSVEVKDNMN
jgi:hypothetical protein